MSNYTESTGNVFLDMGFDEEEAANLLIRSSILIEIREYIREHEMSLTEAAEFFGASRARISDLKKARVQLFSFDYLMGMLSKIGKGMRVEFFDLPKAA